MSSLGIFCIHSLFATSCFLAKKASPLIYIQFLIPNLLHRKFLFMNSCKPLYKGINILQKSSLNNQSNLYVWHLLESFGVNTHKHHPLLYKVSENLIVLLRLKTPFVSWNFKTRKKSFTVKLS